MEEAVEQRIVDQIIQLEKPQRRLGNLREAEYWWTTNAVPSLVAGLSTEAAWLTRKRTFSMIQVSHKKLAVAQIAIDYFYPGFANPITHDPRLVDTLSVGIVGSVGKMEAEPGSDMDLNYFFDNDTCANREDIYSNFARAISNHISGVLPEQAKDFRIFSFDVVANEITGAKKQPEHLANLIFETRWLKLTGPTKAHLQNVIGGLNRGDLRSLLRWRREMARTELAKGEEGLKVGEHYPKTSLFHHVVSWYTEAIAVATSLGVDFTTPYWKILDHLLGVAPRPFKKQELAEIRAAATKTIAIRESDFPTATDLIDAKDKLLKMRDVVTPVIDGFLESP